MTRILTSRKLIKFRDRLLCLGLILTVIYYCSGPSAISEEKCIEEFILDGSITSTCHFQEVGLSIVYAWVNDTDPVYATARSEFTQQSFIQASRSGLDHRVGRLKKHQREHGELGYSITSFKSNLAGNARYFILISDFLVNDEWTRSQVSASLLLKHADVTFVGTSSIMDHNLLPVFNSLSIETHISDIENLSEGVVYVNDDMFLNRKHSQADFHTTLTGPLFHISTNVMVHDAEGLEASEYSHSEWDSLQYTNSLLSRLFGKRARGYVEHISKTASRDVLDEISRVFTKEIATSDSYRFREGPQLNMMFLATWYTIEMQRRNLLETLLMNRYQGNMKELYRDYFMGEAQDTSGSSISLINTVSKALRIANLREPRANKLQSIYLDGYAFIHTSLRLDESCTLAAICHYPDPGISHLEWISLINPGCGDCVLLRVLSSTKGLRTVLPTASDPSYGIALKRAQKYAYAIASTEFEFVNLKSTDALEEQLSRGWRKSTAQICMNDDLSDSLTSAELATADSTIRSFLAATYG